MVVFFEVIDFANTVLEDVVALVCVLELFGWWILLNFGRFCSLIVIICGLLSQKCVHYHSLPISFRYPIPQRIHLSITMQLIPPLPANLFTIQFIFILKGIG